MSNVAPILNYVPPSATAPRKLTMDEADGRVRVAFAVLPKWMYVFQIVMSFLVGLIKIAMGILVVQTLWRMLYQIGPPNPEPNPALIHSARDFAESLWISIGIAVFFWWSFGAFEWWSYHRWGRVPRILTANNEGLSLSWLGWWRMRERKWPASEITAVELRPLRTNLNWTRTAADLYIHRRKGRRLRYRLSSSDSQLPSRIAERLLFVLDCPLSRNVGGLGSGVARQ
jgi:hypothetical protein